MAALLTHTTWMIMVPSIVFIGIILNIAFNCAIKRLAQFAENHKRFVLGDLFSAMQKPLYLFLWIYVVLYAFASLAENLFGFTLSATEGPLLRIVGIVVATWFLLRFLSLSQKRFFLRAATSADKHLIMTAGRLMAIVIVVLASLVVLGTVGVDLAAVLAFGGVGGIVVGFAAKDIVANFFGGIMIYITNPFVVGDFIDSPDRSITGVVEHIGWYQTKILPRNKQPLYVPNSIFSTIVIVNMGRMTHRYIDETIGIRYQDFTKIPKIIEEIRASIYSSDDIDKEQPVFVTFTHFGESSLNIWVSCYTAAFDRAKFFASKQKLLIALGDIIKNNGAEIAFPTTTLDIPREVVIKNVAM